MDLRMKSDNLVKRSGSLQLHPAAELRRIGLYAIVILGAVVSLVPFLTMLFISLKPVQGMFTTPMWLPPTDPTFANYTALFQGSTFTTAIFTTVVVMVAVTAGQVFFSTLAAYAFARMQFRGRNILFWAYLSTLMIPTVVTLI